MSFSITNFRNSLSRYLKPVLVVIAGVFFVSCFAGLGRNLLPGGGARDTGGASVAKVNGEGISLQIYGEKLEAWSVQLERQLNRRPTAAEMSGRKADLLQQMIQETVMLQEADKRKIKVGRSEVNDAVEKAIDQELDQYRSMIKSAPGNRKLGREEVDRRVDILFKDRLGVTLDQYKKQRRDEIRNDVRTGVILNKLMESVRREARVSEKELRDSYRQVRARHILVSTQSLPEAQAKRKAGEIANKLKGGEDFARLAREFSDDPSTKDSGGAWRIPLSSAMPLPLDQAVTKALFALKPGQTSDVIKTPQGFEILRVDSEEMQLPKDFEAKKKQYLAERTRAAQDQAVGQFYQNLMRTAKIEVTDPDLKGYWLLGQARMAMGTGGQAAYQAIIAQAAAQFERARRINENDGTTIYTLASLYRGMGDNDKAIRVLEDALEIRAAVEGADFRMLLGDLYAARKDYKRAEGQYAKAGEQGYNDLSVRSQLVYAYKQIHRNDLAAKEQKWVDDYNRQREMETGPGGGSPTGAAPTPTPPSGGERRQGG